MSGIHMETYGQGRPVVMVHGWAMHTGVWRDFAQALARRCQVICVDLPGHGRSETIEPFTLETVSAALLDAISVQRFSMLGWSLGGMVAMAMAEHAPERIEKLIVLAGNPRFVQTNDWPGVEAETLDGFAELLTIGAAQTVTRFLAIQVGGLAHGRQLLMALKKSLQECPPPDVDVLHAGLAILKNADLRGFILRNSLPIKMILGSRDTLVPVACGEQTRKINSNVNVEILARAGHAPFLSHPEALLEAITGFL
ncbi:MAG: pimeloyl-ACP methyl ester esterase BioH [Gammaproteobacteria bacterium]